MLLILGVFIFEAKETPRRDDFLDSEDDFNIDFDLELFDAILEFDSLIV